MNALSRETSSDRSSTGANNRRQYIKGQRPCKFEFKLMPSDYRRQYKGHARAHDRSYPKRRDLDKRRKRVPRYAGKRLRTAPKTASSAPGVYHFNRGFSHVFTMGDAESSKGWLMNSDFKYMIYQNHVEFNELSGYTEFNALFSEYKINSFQTTWTPSFSNNVARVLNADNSVNKERVMNIELIVIPVRGINLHDFTTMTGTQIEAFLDQSQRQTHTMVPSGKKVFKTLNPKCVKINGPLGKAVAANTYTMGAPSWNSTNNGLTPDTTDITHYGVTILCRRVDGEVLNQTSTQQMEFRASTRVNFSVRKVQ